MSKLEQTANRAIQFCRTNNLHGDLARQHISVSLSNANVVSTYEEADKLAQKMLWFVNPQ